MSIEEETKRASSETPPRNKSKRPGNALKPPIVPDTTIPEPRVKIVIEFMSANLHRKISSTDFAREVRLSGAQVYRLFKEETGIAPGEYLIWLRMQKAVSLLSNRLLSLKEIMTMVGYGNRGHFVEHFKRYFGPAPSEYRKLFSG